MKKEQKIKKLLTEMRAGLKYLARQNKFLSVVQDGEKQNPQFVTALTNTIRAHKAQLVLFKDTYDACTGRKVEPVTVSDTHTKGWGVEMTLPNKKLELVKFRYITVFDVTADREAKKVCNLAGWKYFMADEVNVELWEEIK